jgi:hypothetical protein
MDFVKSDRTLKVGDLVFSRYHKGQRVWQVTDIQKRYLDQSMLIYDVYSAGNVGDEYNPLVTICSLVDLNVVPSSKKHKKITAVLDAAHVVKITPDHLIAQIKKLKDVLNELHI